MLLIPCPWCGPRDETEFSYGGEAGRTRPADPSALTDAEWAEFLFIRTKSKGAHKERWVHTHGCRRWFNVERHTVTNQILAVHAPGAPASVTENAEAATPGHKAGRS
jgi:sarcosine oxidase, subunit delta